MQNNFKQIANFKVIYNNEIAMQELYDSIFDQQIYSFHTNVSTPNIIDAGSNIGIATLFFKSKYPSANILSFEPDPYNFAILKKNIAINNIKNVKVVNAALAKQSGVTSFYGEIDKNADTRGNSIINAWGNQRTTSKTITVKAVKLSSYIKSTVDFLKLDIEGAEQQVLEELGDKLRLIKHLIIEVHETKNIYFENNLTIICQILKDYGFELEIQNINNLDFLPEQTMEWSQKVSPIFSIVKANNPSINF